MAGVLHTTSRFQGMLKRSIFDKAKCCKEMFRHFSFSKVYIGYDRTVEITSQKRNILINDYRALKFLFNTIMKNFSD